MGDLFFEICHHRTHIFCDVKESHNILELKKIIEGIMRVKPENQQLFKVKDGKIGDILQDTTMLTDAGFTNMTAKAQQPGLIGVAFRQQDGNFEQCRIDPVSEPPPLPDVMRSGQAEPAASSVKHEEQAI